MSYSYCIVHRASRVITIVNGGPEDQVDVVLDITPLSENKELHRMHDYYEGIETEFSHDGPPYWIERMIFTANNGSVVNSTYLYFHETGPLVDYVCSEQSHRSAFNMARLVLFCERVRNDLPKVIEESVKTSKCGKEEADGEMCVICHEEYHEEDMIGTLHCNHRYHDECVKKWLMKKENCPLCRDNAIFFRY